QLLPRLTARVERPRHLRAAKGACVEQPAVFAREGHPHRDALIDDVDAQLGETMDVGFARAEVTAFDGIVKQAVDGITVVAIVLGRVDTALGGDAVGTPRTVLIAEA